VITVISEAAPLRRCHWQWLAGHWHWQAVGGAAAGLTREVLLHYY